MNESISLNWDKERRKKQLKNYIFVTEHQLLTCFLF